jgi:hypothetical protein
LQFDFLKIPAIFSPDRTEKEIAMTDDFEDFAQWRGSVDEQLGSLGTKVATEAHLRATMDGDMGKLHAEFRAQRSMLQALHDTQQDHTAQLADLATGQEELRRNSIWSTSGSKRSMACSPVSLRMRRMRITV